MTTINISIDSNLKFSVGGNRIGDRDSIELTAPAGVDVTLQLLAPIGFTASHDEKGTVIRWTPVTTTLASYAAQQVFPCPRSPFTLTVTPTDATTSTKAATKKVRIEAVAASGQKLPRGVSHGHDE